MSNVETVPEVSPSALMSAQQWVEASGAGDRRARFEFTFRNGWLSRVVECNDLLDRCRLVGRHLETEKLGDMAVSLKQTTVRRNLLLARLRNGCSTTT